eukprot:TRINITY_DN7963_c0_g1_i1.p1 TRINITY_DN7963_c0_g1~~TRINITY_DN7963_c0_g1_i1.p1  ORF type:complete len:233 (-),score=34.27 TRINITY_DN7963_c0_g1_i1:102-800(-)
MRHQNCDHLRKPSMAHGWRRPPSNEAQETDNTTSKTRWQTSARAARRRCTSTRRSCSAPSPGTRCHKLLTIDVASEHAGLPYCKTDYQRQFAVKGYNLTGTTTAAPGSTALTSTGVLDAMVTATGTGSEHNSSAKLFEKGCPSCGKPVYMAERTQGVNRDWHKLCFRCWECNGLLHAGAFQEHDGFPFCKKCYLKKFGMEGYGHEGGSRTAFTNTPTTAPTEAATTTEQKTQ